MPLAPRSKARQCPSGEVISAERVLEARVRGAGIDEVRETQLAHVPEPLETAKIVSELFISDSNRYHVS